MKLALKSRFQSDHTMKDQDSGLGCLRMSLSFFFFGKLSSLILPGELPPYIETVCH
ncbi:hypothetical protein N657DRAFT_650852, partial [Parathielavia appendiculata]